MSGTKLNFVAFVRPQPQGSTRAFYVKRLGRSVITSDNAKVKSYRQEVALAARAIPNRPAMIARPRPVALHLKFFLRRPNSLPKKIIEHTKRPDVDKLLRATFDSLAGIVYEDDSQVNRVIVEKNYGLPERVEVSVL